MADDEQRLLISLEARLDKFEKSLRRAQGLTELELPQDGEPREAVGRPDRRDDGQRLQVDSAPGSSASFGTVEAARQAQKLIDSRDEHHERPQGRRRARARI